MCDPTLSKENRNATARRWKKFAGLTILVIITLLVVGITFTIGWRPFIGAKKRALTDLKFAATPQRLARGLINEDLGKLPGDKLKLIVQACDEMIAGKHQNPQDC